MLKNFHRPAWERLMARGGVLSALGAAAVATMLTLAHFFYDIPDYGWGFFMTTFGYSLVALSFALLVAAALSPTARVLQWRIPGAGRIALWSYAIYLSHKPLATFLGHELEPLALSNASQLAIITAACIATGALLHRLVEAPFMALRDRLVPSNFDDDAQPARLPAAAVSP
jgi:peptidoglycan/LPS O-acetylase OafA/YrhL